MLLKFKYIIKKNCIHFYFFKLTLQFNILNRYSLKNNYLILIYKIF